MKIITYKKIYLDNVAKTPIPRLPSDIERSLNSWTWGPSRNNGHEILEKIFTIISDYKFDKRYKVKIDDKTFELLALPDKKIKVSLEYGDADEFPEIIVTEGNISTTYSCLCDTCENKALIDTYKQYEEDKQFTQYYSSYYDCFAVDKDGIRTTFCFDNPDAIPRNEAGPKYLISDELKNKLKNADPNNIVELYNTICENLDPRIMSFSISRDSIITRKNLEKIQIRGRAIAHIKLTKKTQNAQVTIEENHIQNFFSISSTQTLQNPTDYLEMFNETQQELTRKLNKRGEE